MILSSHEYCARGHTAVYNKQSPVVSRPGQKMLPGIQSVEKNDEKCNRPRVRCINAADDR